MTGGSCRTCLFACLAALVLGAAGCSDAANDRYGDASPALWQVESASGEVEGWLFGTIHALPEDTRWRTPAFDEALERSDLLVVEVADLDDAGTYSAVSHTSGTGLLSDRVSPENRAALRKLLASEGLADSAFYDVEDWAAAIALARYSRDGDPGHGVDRALIAEARGFGSARPVRELEGLQRQLRIFDRLPVREQRALLDGAVERYAGQRNEAGELRKLWLAGDVDRLGELVIDEIDETPLLLKTLLTDRNRAMARKVQALLERPERPFVAVGTGHMAGETGLPALLEREGYVLRRIQ